MRKTLLILFVLISQIAQSQSLTNNSLHARYAYFYEWDDVLGKYQKNGSDWMSTSMYVCNDYYMIKVDEEEPKMSYWEYDIYNSIKDTTDVYNTENGGRVVIDFQTGAVSFFYNKNKIENRYNKVIVITKITVEDVAKD